MKVLQTLLAGSWMPGSNQDRLARLMRLPEENHACAESVAPGVERLVLDSESWRVCFESVMSGSDQGMVCLNEPFVPPYEQFWLEHDQYAFLVNMQEQQAVLVMRCQSRDHGPFVSVVATIPLHRMGKLVKGEIMRFASHDWTEDDCSLVAKIVRVFAEACILIGSEHIVSIRRVFPGQKTGRQRLVKSKYSQPVFSHNVIELRFPMEMTVVDGEARWSDARGGNMRAHHVRAYTAKRSCKDADGNRYVKYVVIESHKRGNEALGWVVKTTKMVA